MSNSTFTAFRANVMRAGIVLSVIILGCAGYLLFRALRAIRMEDIVLALRDMSAQKLWYCAILTGVSFLGLGFYDVIAARRVAPGRVSAWRAWFAGAEANAISNTLGFHALTATAVRLRLYAKSGLSVGDVARIVSLSWSGLAFGFLITLAFALLLATHAAPWERGAGIGLLGLLAVCAQWLGRGRSARLWSFRIALPSRNTAIAQMLIGGLEMTGAISALYVLMPANAPTSFAAFSCIYIGAVLLGIASHAPGGLGVFEATMMALGQRQDQANILAALLIYRLIYNLLPFALAAAGLAIDEIARISSSADTAG